MSDDTYPRISKVMVPVFLGIAAMLVFSSTLLIGGAPQEKLTVYTVNYPLQYFAERIGGEYVDVVFPAPSQGDPAYWNPNAKIISDYQNADLILLNGANYAKWVSKASLSRSRMVNTSVRFMERYLTSGEVTTHSHGPEGEHAHESLAFTTWLDFDLAAKQARSIADALIRKMPDKQSTFLNNYKALEKDLLGLDQRMRRLAAIDPAKPLVVSHPVYDYWAHRYGLNIKSVHWEPDRVPDKDAMDELQVLLSKHPAKWMVWEGRPLDEAITKLKSVGVSSLVFAPCGNTPGQGDFLSNMQENIKNLFQAYK